MSSHDETRADLRLIETAIRDRWPISESARADVIARLELIALDDSQKTRVQLAAIRALIAADRVNLEEIRIRTEVTSESITAAIAQAEARLGDRADANTDKGSS